MVGIDVTTTLLFTLSDDVQQNETVRVQHSDLFIVVAMAPQRCSFLATAFHRFASGGRQSS